MEAVLSVAQAGRFDATADVVVVGLGMAGACAALGAADKGGEVLVIERASGGGGTSATSEGIFYLGGGTRMQLDCGFEDNSEEVYKFLIASTSGSPDKVRAFADGGPEHFDWLEQQGVEFSNRAYLGKAVFLTEPEGGLLTTGNEKVWPFRDQARPAPRGHQPVRTKDRSSGSLVMEALIASCERNGVKTLYDARVIALIMDDEQVVGVRFRCEGQETNVSARKAVILTTGSFNANHELVARHCPQVSSTCLAIGAHFNDGSGLMLGEAAGGALEGMDGIIATASLYPPSDLIKGIVVNELGERFVPEDAYHGRLADFISEQPNQTAYLIVDSEIFAYPQDDPKFHALVDGWETIGEMELGLGLPLGSLQKTIAEYNADAASNCDRRFHKYPEWIKQINQPPYAAFDISFNKSTYSFLTLGGLRTNVDGQVLGDHDKPIPGLYAAGACSAQLTRNGKEYASGLNLGPGSLFGRRAGGHAAAC